MSRFDIVMRMITRLFIGKPLLFNLNLNVTTRCNQNCPMCNAVLDKQPDDTLTLVKLKAYLKAFKGVPIPSVTLSGGEPTLAPEFPDIVKYCKERFPFGVGMVSNFYSKGARFKDAMDAALKADIRIACSFDGFGRVAEERRGVPNVDAILMENIAWVSERKKELGSKSKLAINTVISDQNIYQVKDIIDVAVRFGWISRLSCFNPFFSSDDDPMLPTLNESRRIAQLINEVLGCEAVKENPHFLMGIPVFADKSSPKLCPYLRWPYRKAKVFLNPNGDVLLCDRMPIGNVLKDNFEDLVSSREYKDRLNKFKECKGCWIPCFVEPMLPLSPVSRLRIRRRFKKLLH